MENGIQNKNPDYSISTKGLSGRWTMDIPDEGGRWNGAAGMLRTIMDESKSQPA